MGRAQVLYNRKKAGRGGGRGRGGGCRSTDSRGDPDRRSQHRRPLPPPPQPNLSGFDEVPTTDEQVEQFLALGSATANHVSALGGQEDTNLFAGTTSGGSMLVEVDPSQLAASLYKNYSRGELLRLPDNITSKLYGSSSPPATYIDVTEIQDDQASKTVRNRLDHVNEKIIASDPEEGDDCVVYLGTKQASDTNNDDDLDDWLDSVIS